MPGVIATIPKQQFNSATGVPLVLGTLTVYAAGTTTPDTTYQDQALTIANTNPIQLDARGECSLWLDSAKSYKFVLKDAFGVTQWTQDNVGGAATGASLSPTLSLYAKLADLLAVTGASMVGFIQAGVGAVARTVREKLRDTVSVKDFGAVGDGVADDTAAIQAAIDSFGSSVGTLHFPRGVYKISAALTLAQSGMQIAGDAPSNTYLTSAAASTFDMLRIAGSYCRVSGIQFRPGGSQICMRIYAAHATVDNNRFLASANNAGTGILLADTDPITAAFVAGAYTHRIINNLIGVSGFAFANAIDDATTAGIQATQFHKNQILSDTPIRITRGGGNTYIGNLLQTSTGTIGTPVGNGIDLGANVTGEMIYGNYFEKFAVGTLTRQLSNTYQAAHFAGNQIDNCTAPFSSLGTVNYVYENPISNTRFQNGWTLDFSNTAYLAFRTITGTFAFGMDSSANFVAGITSSTSHHIKKVAAQGGVILQVDGGARGSYFQTVDGAGGNAANTALNIGANGVTLRSINAGGTVNASGLDYAEYMVKSGTCGVVAKGQIVGIDANGSLTDKWADSIAFCVKSTDPSYVAGDTWAAHLGERPLDPDAMAVFETQLEAARQTVDRIAFSGQVPVNVLGAQAGDYIIPVQDGTGIKGVAVANPSFEQYRMAVGLVIGIEPDGRAWIIVKVA